MLKERLNCHEKDDSSISQQAKTFLAMRRKVKDLGSDDNGKIAR